MKKVSEKSYNIVFKNHKLTASFGRFLQFLRALCLGLPRLVVNIQPFPFQKGNLTPALAVLAKAFIFYTIKLRRKTLLVPLLAGLATCSALDIPAIIHSAHTHVPNLGIVWEWWVLSVRFFPFIFGSHFFPFWLRFRQEA